MHQPTLRAQGPAKSDTSVRIKWLREQLRRIDAEVKLLMQQHTVFDVELCQLEIAEVYAVEAAGSSQGMEEMCPRW